MHHMLRLPSLRTAPRAATGLRGRFRERFRGGVQGEVLSSRPFATTKKTRPKQAKKFSQDVIEKLEVTELDFGKHAGIPLWKVPVDYFAWMAAKGAKADDEALVRSITSLHPHLKFMSPDTDFGPTRDDASSSADRADTKAVGVGTRGLRPATPVAGPQRVMERVLAGANVREIARMDHVAVKDVCTALYKELKTLPPQMAGSAVLGEEFWERVGWNAEADVLVRRYGLNEETIQAYSNRDRFFRDKRRTFTSPYLIFDVETTGFPKRPRAPWGEAMLYSPITETAHYDSSRVLQVAWQLVAQEPEQQPVTLTSRSCYIQLPSPVSIPEASMKVHGISEATIEDKGISIFEVGRLLMADLESAETIVGHNLAFDAHVLAAELHRFPTLRPHALTLMKKFNETGLCTMELAQDEVGATFADGKTIKFPSLAESLHHFFPGEKHDAHDAAADTEAAARVFFALKRSKGLQ